MDSNVVIQDVPTKVSWVIRVQREWNVELKEGVQWDLMDILEHLLHRVDTVIDSGSLQEIQGVRDVCVVTFFTTVGC
ncbi:hypothetical protein WICPIJ_003031 [Wickerhamomyces pijperi]|uniref:Uncharacterized protein n=1 Tax=Wickerhamomyces pijperi TaxID=599730 RepID=A0A9P8TPN0_WICPI|nr:hypothetical protein WICPIJ_003031 [Wickerhamomyces pijperi]